MTLTGIDHLVIAVRDVEAAAAALEADLGLAVTGGGRHETGGTFNRLAFLGDTYLELIGVFDRALVEATPAFAVAGVALALLGSGREGLATLALATDDVRTDVARLRAAASSIGQPVAGSRRRPDGETVRWVTAFPVLGPERPPFVIEHEMAGAEWGDEARAERARFRHPIGGRVRLSALELPVGDPAAVAGEYGAVLGIAFSEGWRTRIGPHEVVLRRTGTPGGPPVVRLSAEAGTPGLDVERFGVRWVREASAS
jgi:hypothetical protein